MNWRVAKSLDHLLAQINAAAPRRSKASDGSIGDAAHASRTSDHNPYIRDRDGVPVVRARDFTHDPKGGFDSYAFARDLVKHKQNWKKIRYVISNYEIWNQAKGWQPYHGKNPHDHHVHVSVPEDQDLYDDTSDWVFTLGRSAPVPGTGIKAPPLDAEPVLRQGDKGPAVKALQALLKIIPDGDFGPKTKEALVTFQKSRGLVADGILGPQTRKALRAAPAPDVPPRSDFDRIMEWVFEDEGGMTISPDEPGGASNLGVSMETYAKYLGRPVTQKELAALTKSKAAEIYKKLYWTDEIAKLPSGLNYAAFDFGVNSGVSRVASFVERAQDYSADVSTQIDSMLSQRLAYLRQSKNWNKYGKGWTNRIERVRLRAKSMVKK